MWGRRWGTMQWGKWVSQDDRTTLPVRGSVHVFVLQEKALRSALDIYERKTLEVPSAITVRAELQALLLAGRTAIYNRESLVLGSALLVYERRRHKRRGAVHIFTREQQEVHGSISIAGMPILTDATREVAPALSDARGA